MDHAPIPGHATADATRAHAKRCADEGAAPGHARDALGLTVSSIGLGTYLGAADDATDAVMAEATADVVRRGLNVLDTAINYRDERSERSVGAGVRALVAEGIPREALFVSTKAGFLTETVPHAVLEPSRIAAGCHAMDEPYLRWAIERCRRNLGLATIDLFYLHNPETQLERLDTDAWLDAVADAFRVCEDARAEGSLRRYGLATWNGLRVPADAPGHIPLEAVVARARDVGGADHGLAAVQLPLSLGMPEGITEPTQTVGGEALGAVEAADRLGLAVFTSASTAQGRITKRLPPGFADDLPGADGSPTRALLQWTRSCPGVTTALVGMTQAAHRDENLALVARPPMDATTAKRFVTG